jgi:hypothetical protein
MREIFARLWTAELRSGRYVQGKRFLSLVQHEGYRDTDEHCCLGVACQMYVANHPRYPWIQADARHHIEYGPNNDSRLLPQTVQMDADARSNSCVIWHPFMRVSRSSGFRKLEPFGRWEHAHPLLDHKYPSEFDFMSLTMLNDDNFTFAQIADVIDFFWDCI